MSRQHNASASRLRAFVNRIERLDEEIDERNQDKAEVYKGAKGEGFDLPALREIIAKRRKMAKDPAKFAEHRDIVEMYEAELGGDAPASRVHAREERKPKERAPRSAYQPPRMASPRELLEAHRAGNPISQDFTFQDGSIYFAVSQENGSLKIGLSNNVPDRLSALQNDCRDLELLGTVAGNRQEELRLLEQFAAWNMNGEWFQWCDATERMVAAILKPEFDANTGEVLGDAPAPAESATTATVRIGDGPEISLEDFRKAAQSINTPAGMAAVDGARDPVTGIASPVQALGAIIKDRHPEPAKPTPYRVTDPAPVPAAPDPDVSPLIADQVARMEAARQTLERSAAE